MKNLFVNNEDEIKVHLFVGSTKSGILMADTDLSILKDTVNFDEESVEEYDIIFRMPTFKDSVDLTADMFNYSGQDQGLDFNPLAVRYGKIVKLIKSWTFKNSDGEVLPCTEENISHLNPAIANAIGLALDVQVPTL